MTIRNLIKKENKFAKEYFAQVVNVEDELHRGRIQVKIDAILGDIPFWVNATLVAGTTKLLLVPEVGDMVTVRFKNEDIYSGEWELKSSPHNKSEIDPNKYGMQDVHGNCMIVDKKNKAINVTVLDGTITITANVKDGDEIKPASTIVVNSDGSISITSKNVTIKASENISMTADKNITMKAEKVIIDSDTEITKTLKVTGECQFKGITWSTHKHPYTHGGTASGGDITGNPQ